mgnify:FL=1
MNINLSDHQLRLKAAKRIEEIKGFYTHLIATFFIPPFLIFINLKTAPQFEWFWFALVAWAVGLIIHWFYVFGSAKFFNNWEANKLNEAMLNHEDKSEFIQEQYYLKTKKKVKEIKGFYVHFGISILAIIIIVLVNLQFVPSFHFFWYAVGGISIGLFFHWFGVFGFSKLGFGKTWEEKKIQEFMNKKN